MPATVTALRPTQVTRPGNADDWLDNRVSQMMANPDTQVELLDELMEFDDGPKRAAQAALRALLLNPVGTPGHESAADSFTQLLHAQAFARARGELNRLAH